jgi:hypothetical protein
MDKIDSDLVNRHDPQSDQTGVTSAHLRTKQEDSRMPEPEVEDRICEMSGQGLASKRIARQLGVSRNSVRPAVLTRFGPALLRREVDAIGSSLARKSKRALTARSRSPREADGPYETQVRLPQD